MIARMRLPDFFIIGAAKAGTTTLYEILRQHRQVFLPVAKEPAFFCDDEYYDRGVDWYVDTHFRGARGAAVAGEATSTYLYWGSKVAPRIADAYGSKRPRIIAIFRDPVSLVHSFYWHSVREARESLGFREALAAESERLGVHGAFLRRRGRIVYSYSRIAQYATQLEPYLELFPRSRCLFLLTEDLADFPGLVGKLQAFLELDDEPGLKPVVSNVAALPRSPALHRWLRESSGVKEIGKRILPFPVRHRLKTRAIQMNLKPLRIPSMDADLAHEIRRHYADEVKRLEGIIGRDLSRWYAEA
jgi:Sulfotransferase domain